MQSREELQLLFREVIKVLKRLRPVYEEYAINIQHKEELEKERKQLPLLIALGIGWAVFSISLFNDSFMLAVLMLLGSIFCVIYAIAKTPKINEQLPVVEKRINYLEKQLDFIYLKSSIVGKYPQAYLYDDAVSYCITMIKNMRADSVKEAINLYEDNLYRVKMEKLEREKIRLVDDIREETNQARKAAQLSAAFSGITAYNTHKIKKQMNQDNR